MPFFEFRILTGYLRDTYGISTVSLLSKKMNLDKKNPAEERDLKFEIL